MEEQRNSRDPEEQPTSDLLEDETYRALLDEIAGQDAAMTNQTLPPNDPNLMFPSQHQQSAGPSMSNQQPPTVRPKLNASNNQKQSTMDVKVPNKHIRFRYATELGNRNFGKEELISVEFINIYTEVYIRVHCVDARNKRAHPYSIIGDKCRNGVYYEKFIPTQENKYTCVCKGTIKIPKRGEYEQELKDRKLMMEQTIGIITEDMKKSSYWNTNKSIRECQSICLSVEVFYKTTQMYMLQKVTESLVNAKEGKAFSVHTIRPFAFCCRGSFAPNDNMLIVLTADSYIPRGVDITFYDEEGWETKPTGINIIKNVLEFSIPAYKTLDLMKPKEVFIKVSSDKQLNLVTKPIKFMYTPQESYVYETKKRKLQDWQNIPEEILEDAIGPSVGDQKKNLRKHLHSKRIKDDKQKPSATATSTTLASQPLMHRNNDPMMNVVDYQYGQVNPPFTTSAPSFLLPSGYKDSASGYSDQMAAASGYNDQLTIPPLQHYDTSSVSSPAQSLMSCEDSNDILSLVSTASQLQPPQNNFMVASPPSMPSQSIPPSPGTSNFGKFKTLPLPGTGQWVLIDNAGKPILVCGGQDADHVIEVQSGSGNPLSPNTCSLTPDCDLEEDTAGESLSQQKPQVKNTVVVVDMKTKVNAGSQTNTTATSDLTKNESEKQDKDTDIEEAMTSLGSLDLVDKQD